MILHFSLRYKNTPSAKSRFVRIAHKLQIEYVYGFIIIVDLDNRCRLPAVFRPSFYQITLNWSSLILLILEEDARET